MPEPDDFLNRLSRDDPDYELAKRFHHEACADSYGLEAEAVAGRASFSDFIDGCVHLFEQTAETLVAIRDDAAIEMRCKKLDELAKKFIRKTKVEIDNQSERLGEAKVNAASNDFSQRVLEISARSKRQIHETALAESTSHRQGMSDAQDQRSDAFGGDGHRTTGPLDDVDPAQPAVNVQGIAKEARMNRPSRYEIDKFANQVFAVSRDDILAEYVEKRNRVLAGVRRSGNSGSYLPALTNWGAERVGRTVLALASAYVEAFTLHRVPSDMWAETDLQSAAQQIAGGTISAIRGELELLNARTRNHVSRPSGYIDRQVQVSMKTALQKGLLLLRRQRIEFKDSESSRQRVHPPPQEVPRTENSNDVSPRKDFINVGDLMRSIGQPLTPEWYALFGPALAAAKDLGAKFSRPTLTKMLRLAARKELSDKEFRSHLPVLLRELGLEIPDGVLQPPCGRAGRPVSTTTGDIHVEWGKNGKA